MNDVCCTGGRPGKPPKKFGFSVLKRAEEVFLFSLIYLPFCDKYFQKRVTKLLKIMTYYFASFAFNTFLKLDFGYPHALYIDVNF